MLSSEVVLPMAAGVAVGLAAGGLLAHIWHTSRQHTPPSTDGHTQQGTNCDDGAAASGYTRLPPQSTRLPPEAQVPATHSKQRGGSSSNTSSSPELFHYRPIGYLRSCFTTRNGTPRQPMLVTAARSRLELLPDVPHAAFDGLEAWSHVWILYIFHDNTEPHVKAPVGDLSYVKGKVRVPRLNGDKVGLFATRTPHRPAPIGLSVAQVISVNGRVLVLGGADVVDGSPVLDIKPYVPFCDSVPLARAPAYVQAEAEDEPLAVSKVVMTEVGRQQLTACWHRNTQRTLYATAEEYIQLVCQVLSRDIRSLRQRLHVGKAAQQRNTASVESAAAVATRLPELLGREDEAGLSAQGVGATNGNSRGDGGSQQGTGVFHVLIEGVDVSYDVGADGVVIIGGGSLDTDLATRHRHKHLSS